MRRVARGRDRLTVSVNMSAETLKVPRIAEVVAGLLEETGVAAGWLTLEVTESMMSDPARARAALGTLRDAGVRISIDVLGIVYSSLAYLKDLPVDEVKIDRGFVGEMAGSGKGEHIVRSIIELGHNLGLRVVAEGVEDEVSLELLTSWGCDLAQGYYFSRPLPACDIGAMLDRLAGSSGMSDCRGGEGCYVLSEGGQRDLDSR
jgi:EAL domain-containing protein (putative c-di-GMP-specific phosphodiesterase class I)